MQPQTDDASKGGSPPERLSPAVRRLAAEHNVDLSSLRGSGEGGRITRDDVLKAAGKSVPQPAAAPEPQPLEEAPESGVEEASATTEETQAAQEEEPAEEPPPTAAPKTAQPPAEKPSASRKVARTKFEKRVAESILQSASAPRVSSVFELEVGDEADGGDPWPLMARVLMAAAQAMLAVPELNARYSAGQLEGGEDVNAGVGLFVDGAGLVVPILRRVQELDLPQIEEQLRGKAARSAEGKLSAGDLSNGTFTVYHPGQSSALYSLPPTVYEPQVAALSVGGVQRRAAVVGEGEGESLQIRSMAYAALSVDCRVLDWRQADAWIGAFTAAFRSV